MLQRLLSRLLDSSTDRANQTPRNRALSANSMEKLEGRLLMHSPTFTAVTADNRGEVFITVEASSRAELAPTAISSAAIQMFTPGPDNVLGTVDDIKQPCALGYNQAIGRITVRARALAADQQYRLRVVPERFRSNEGNQLDGEFNGAQSQTGNGIAGGIFEIRVRRDTSTRPTVRMSTSAGTMNISLFKDSTPLNASNFLAYVNTGRYDNFFFSRAEAGFVIQAGGIKIASNNTVVDNPPFQKNGADVKVTGEPGISNTRGRLSMALTGSIDPATAKDQGTNEFFINVGNNSFLDTQTGNAQQGFSGPFTAFGELRGANDLATLDAIATKPTINFATLTPPLNFSGTATSAVPVNDAAVAQAGLNPNRDLITVRRTAVISRIFGP